MGTVSWCTDSHGLGELDHSGESLLIDVLVDVDTLSGNTDLSRVLESAHDELRSDSLDVNIGENDGGVVAAELESDTLECLGAGSHDLLAGGNRSSEGDLGNTRVSSEHWTEGVITANGLNNTRWEDILGNLDDLECGVRGERAGLDDDGVTSQDSWEDLSEGQNDGKVLQNISEYPAEFSCY